MAGKVQRWSPCQSTWTESTIGWTTCCCATGWDRVDLQNNGDLTSSTYSWVHASKWSVTRVFRPPGLPFQLEFHEDCPYHQISLTQRRENWIARTMVHTRMPMITLLVCLPKESGSELILRTVSFVNIFNGRYWEIKRVLPKSKTVLIHFAPTNTEKTEKSLRRTAAQFWSADWLSTKVHL